MKNSIDDTVVLQLTPEAAEDKRIWEVVIDGLKGKERMDHIRAYISRYGVLPHLSQNMRVYTANR
jgi:hypothetical protein